MKKVLLIAFLVALLAIAGCKQAQIANPASTNCIEQGGKLAFQENENGTVGICTLPDGTECEEWALFRGECPAKAHYCTPESRNAEVCTAEYNPVCGWFNSSVKCIKYPCAITASNPCVACSNPLVDYWTQGECQK